MQLLLYTSKKYKLKSVVDMHLHSHDLGHMQVDLVDMQVHMSVTPNLVHDPSTESSYYYQPLG